MPNDKLAKPQVTTLAKPGSEQLLAARFEVQRNPKLQQVFRQAKEEGWTSDVMADRISLELHEELEGSVEELYQVGLYLADEYLQVGDSMLVISTETGQAITRVTDKDIWQPPPAPREGSDKLAKRLPQLDPKLEGMLVEWCFTQGREKRLEALLAPRLNQTALQRQQGDRRLEPATLAGRKRITNDITERLSELLPDACKGTSREFLNLFEINGEPTPEMEAQLQCVCLAQVRTPVSDPTTFNLKHDYFTSVSARIATQWVREIARTLALAASNHLDPIEVGVRELDGLPGFWVADPNEIHAINGLKFPAASLSVSAAPTIRLTGPVGVITINPESYAGNGREFLDRWEVLGKCEFELHVDWSQVQLYNLQDVPISGVSVEVMQ